MRLAVIGGGVSGLAAAHRATELARERGLALDLTLLEGAERLGGIVHTERRDGFLIEGGADSFISEKPWALALCRRLGVEDRLARTDDRYRSVFVARGGRLHPLPAGFQMMAPTRLAPLLASPLFSWPGKARMNPPGTLDTVDVNALCPYDQAKAKALLAEAGYGPAKPLTFELMADTEKSVFNVIATVIKEQMARIGVTANIKLVDKTTWLVTSTQDGVFDMFIEDLASLLTVDQNSYLSASTAAWNHSRHTDTKIDDFYLRYARELDPAKRKAIAKEFQEYSADKLYWNTISGSPFYQAAQPWMKDYVYQAEFKVQYKKVWLDK